MDYCGWSWGELAWIDFLDGLLQLESCPGSWRRGTILTRYFGDPLAYQELLYGDSSLVEIRYFRKSKA